MTVQERKTLRAYLINPILHHISVVETNGSLQDIYEYTECHCIVTVRVNDEQDTMFVDDNGLSKPFQSFFAFADYPNPLAGIALILGTDIKGDSASVKALTLKQLRRDIRFITKETAIKMAQLVDVAGAKWEAEESKDGFAHIHVPIADIIESTDYTKEPGESE